MGLQLLQRYTERERDTEVQRYKKLEIQRQRETEIKREDFLIIYK